MFNKIILIGMFLLLLTLASCGPAQTPLPTPQALPNLTGDWSIKMTQSGGIMGLHRSIEIASDGKMRLEMARGSTQSTEKQLTSGQIQKLKDLVNSARLTSPTEPNATCADCFVYDIQITSGGRGFSAQLNDVSLPGSGMEELVKYLIELMNLSVDAY